MTLFHQTQRPAVTSGSATLSTISGASVWTTNRRIAGHKQDNYYYDPYTNVDSEEIVTQQAAVSDYSFVQGWDNPNFYERKSAGELLPSTPWIKETKKAFLSGYFDLDLRYYEGPEAVHPYAYHTDGYLKGKNDGPFIPDGWSLAHDEFSDNFSDYRETFNSVSTDSVVQRAAARIYSSGFDALTSGAEFHKTLRLFKGFKKRLLNYIKKGKLPELYLEGRYGWRILMYELMELHAVFTTFSKERTRYTEIAFAGQNDRLVSATKNFSYRVANPVGNPMLRDYLFITYSNVTSTARFSLKGTVTGDFKPSKFQANPIATAWELIPFSFVIDWFIGVGSWIEAMSFDNIATDYVAAGGVKGEFSLTPTTVGGGINGADPTALYIPSPERSGFVSNGSIDVDLIDRRPTTISNVPQTSINLNTFKVFDLIALLSKIGKDLPKGARF